jgi:hypothetical protein
MFSFVCVCVCVLCVVCASISTCIESVFWSWNNNLQHPFLETLFTLFFSWFVWSFCWIIGLLWKIEMSLLNKQTNKQTNKPQRNWTWRKLVEWVDGFQDNKTFVLFCFCFQFLWFQSIGANSVLIIFSLIPFIHFTICDFASFRLCLFTKLLMQRNNIWEWLENPLVFYCTTFSTPFWKTTHKKAEGRREERQ